MKLIIAIKKATQVAKESTMKHKIGAILFDRNQYVTGFNHTHGVDVPTRKNRWSIHAEEMAIIKGNRTGIDFLNSTLVVIRINKSGNIRLSKPCIHCQKLINKMKIPKVYYSSDPLRRELTPQNFKSFQ